MKLFWLLVILPGLVHPFLLVCYYLLLAQRGKIIGKLEDRLPDAKKMAITSGGSSSITPGLKMVTPLKLFNRILPIALTSLISIASSVVIISSRGGNNWLGLPNELWGLMKATTPAMIAGFTGAYIWGLYNFIERLRILNLPIWVLHSIWFNLLLGPVLGHFLYAFLIPALTPDFAAFVIFGIMALPNASILKTVQYIALQRIGVGSQDQEAKPQWELIQGLTPDIISRLVEAGISSVTHLANQDPIQLLRSTNLEWRNVLDMMDQAYLAAYIGDAITKLRVKGIRGAIEMAVLWIRYLRASGVEREEIEELIATIAEDLNVREGCVLNLMRNMWEDRQVDLIWSLWNGRELASSASEITTPAAAI